MADDLKDRAITAGRVSQSQGDVASIRKQPISPQLESVLSKAAEHAGVRVDVVSGGQPGIGSGGPRTGSTRHDHGNAADLNLYARNADGSERLLDFTNKSDLPTVKKFVTAAVAAGATGIGAGVGYMGPNTLHVGFGKEATWGGAPWLNGAFNAGRQVRVLADGLPAGTLRNQIVTNYWPIKGGRDVGVEGSDKTSRPDPSGAYRVSTLEDYRTGKADHVTIAADPSHYGEWYTIPSYTYINAKGEQHTLKNVPAYVHDTGSAFQGRRRKFDVAADYSTGDSHGARLDRANGNLNAGAAFVPGRPSVAEAPKPGSTEYWAQGRAAKSDTEVASASPDASKSRAGQAREPAEGQTAPARQYGGAKASGRQRSNFAAAPSREGFGTVALQGDGHGPGLVATSYEVDLPPGDGDIDLTIPVPMTFV